MLGQPSGLNLYSEELLEDEETMEGGIRWEMVILKNLGNLERDLLGFSGGLI